MAHTLRANARHELEVKNSRFLAQAAAVTSPDQALDFIRTVAHPDATHNCWAYRIDANYRSSDDGEPAGTAGRPILAAIDGQGYDRVAVVVTRWYGGIKLGAGGLVRAYGGCVAECLRGAERELLVVLTQLTLAFPFHDTGAVHATLAAHSAQRLDETYDAEGVRLRLQLPRDAVDTLLLQLRDATRDRVRRVED